MQCHCNIFYPPTFFIRMIIKNSNRAEQMMSTKTHNKKGAGYDTRVFAGFPKDSCLGLLTRRA